MVRTYKKKPKIKVICRCGCGRARKGRASLQYYSDYCRVTAWLKRKREEKQLENGQK